MSRLERLVSLLDTGSSTYIRNVAAEQLADVQKQHPEELFPLLGRVVPFLRSTKWDTRIAAARAIGLIADSVSWAPDGGESAEIRPEIKPEVKAEVKSELKTDPVDEGPSTPREGAVQDAMTFEGLDIRVVIAKGSPLLGSAGKEYDQAVQAMDVDQRMRVQRQALKRRLGMEFMDDDDLDSDLDISVKKESVEKPQAKTESVEPEDTPKPVNARLRALAKRKAKFGGGNSAKVRAVDSKPPARAGKIAEQAPNPQDKIVVQHRDKSSEWAERVATKDPRAWPFEALAETLVLDMFEPQWEARHGALLGLREIVRAHGNYAGMLQGSSKAFNDRENARWLEDLACRLCCVLALDRFADYVADRVVAPVRESCAQTLGALLLHLNASIALDGVFRVLVQLAQGSHTVWAASHGGMLGLQYLVNVRPQLVTEDPRVFGELVQCVLKGLGDDDDVQAIAAAVLLPVAAEFVATRPSEEIRVLLGVVWDCLSGSNERDELSTAVGSVMDLLARLCAFPTVLDVLKASVEADPERSFACLVPSLYPFLRHSIVDVRKAVLRTLRTFLGLPSATEWVSALTLRLIFQNLLLEQNDKVVELSMELWSLLMTHISSSESAPVLFAEVWPSALPLIMTPIGSARRFYRMDERLLVKPSGQAWSEAPPAATKLQVNIDGPIVQGDTLVVDMAVFLRARVNGSIALGHAAAVAGVPSEFVDVLLSYGDAAMSSQRLVLCLILEETAKNMSSPASLASRTSSLLLDTTDLAQAPLWRDLNPILRAVRTQCQSLFSLMISQGGLDSRMVPQLPSVIEGDAVEPGTPVFTLKQAEDLAGPSFTEIRDQLPPETQVQMAQSLEDGRRNLLSAISEARTTLDSRNTSIRAAAAAAFLALNHQSLPPKLNPIIRALMDGVKTEADPLLHRRTATTVAELVRQLQTAGRKPAAAKIVRNCCAFLCVDVGEAPEFPEGGGDVDGVLSLRREDRPDDALEAWRKQKETHGALVKRQGALLALGRLAETYGAQLFAELPDIRDQMFGTLGSQQQEINQAKGQSLIDNMAVVRALLPQLHPDLYPQVAAVLPRLRDELFSSLAVIRFVSAKCFATTCRTMPTIGITYMVQHVLPSISDQGNLAKRQGAIEAVHHVLLSMGESVLPYIVFFIVPVLGRMSDSDRDVRMIAAMTFAAIIKLVPLESGVPDPVDMPQELLENREREREFIGQMMDASKAKPFPLPVQVHATLRKYQQDGVNWLAFLNKYHLHGILCDDMGLGKTLQTICMVASDHHLRAEDHTKTGNAETRRLPSLIICPTTLTGHWVQEFGRYTPELTVTAYVGSPARRQALVPSLAEADIVVTSYDTARKDVGVLGPNDWNYCVLDEGHIIKNAGSKLAKAVKEYRSNHRLVLSGTPIQNNVLELWSLFDFLMPGFLGSEKSFNDRFAKPIAASNTDKASPRDQEAAALALEALHKQVLPFTLRRLKEDVLDDLPPKIIQDYYCELSDRQRKLYDAFTQRQKQTVAQELNNTSDQGAKQHIFQALQYLRKLCNHPAFVEYTRDELPAHLPLDATESSKMMALQQLLFECGIGVDSSGGGPANGVPEVTSPHRALIFCQQREMLDLVEKSLLRAKMPTVSYMRMDGSTPGPHRADMVTAFNDDPSIDVLLLTTHVGGLGLNLTGADTVIFVEHDWNPMNDLQAMDRAHRIGQKRVVNVYRLITRNTLEERIMGLQEFKMNIASTVINQQNKGLLSMGTDQILDLFQDSLNEPGASGPAKEEEPPEVDATGKLVKDAATATGLGELWDEAEYAEEYNLDTFIKNLKGPSS